MFHLGGSTFPATREQLTAAVTDGLRSLFTLPAGRSGVNLDGGDYPAFDRVGIDLTGARAEADRLPPEPKGTGQNQPGVSAGRLEVSGHPLYLRQAAVDLSLNASDARFDYDRDSGGRPLLVLTDAKNGQVTIEIRKVDLEALVLAGAKEAAAQQGVQIQEIHLNLTQIDSRSIGADVRVKAKKMFISATLTLRGKLSVDEALNATLADLQVNGEGMLGDMASAAIRPKLQEINGKSYPLNALSLGQVHCAI